MEIGELGCLAGVGGGCVWKQYVTSFGTPFPFRGAVVAHAALTASTEADRASFLRWSKEL